MDDDSLFLKKNWAPVWLKDPGRAILGWPALWDLPRLFATPAKNMFMFENGWKYEMVSICSISEGSLQLLKKRFRVWKRLETQNSLYSLYIQDICPRSVQLIYLNNKSPHLNNYIIFISLTCLSLANTLTVQVSSPQRDPSPPPHCTRQAGRTPGQALSVHLKLQILLREGSG